MAEPLPLARPADLARLAELAQPALGRVAVRVWSRRYTTALVAADVASILTAIAGAGLAGVPYAAGAGLVLVLSWLAALQWAGGYEIRHISVGAEEYKRVLRASAVLVGVLAAVCFAADLSQFRRPMVVVVPPAFALICLARYAVRQIVHLRRTHGHWTSRILAVGTRESVRDLVEVARRAPYAGLQVVGACVQNMPVGTEVLPGVPVVGGVRDAADVAAAVEADVVAVAGTGLGARHMRELGWQLEGSGRDLVMAPELTEVAGPRVHVSPVEGLPLMWVDQPDFTGFRRVVKRAVDLLGASLILLLVSPLLLLTGLAVRLSSRGPAVFSHTRLGQHGVPFTVYKFRSMYHDAEARRADLLGQNEADGGLLFKIRRDPRVTRVGRLLRKSSLDELPQLFNVLRGSMSLVGPRPPLPSEVARYGDDVRRRLLVKPGMTGLWQVSGRSNLSWDEGVRLDLYYVENWSLALDLAIIARTIWAVARSRGAY